MELSKEKVLETIKNYEKLLERVREVVNEIGFLDSEFDTLEMEKTEFFEDTVHVVAYDSHYDMYDSTSCSFPIDFLFEEEDKHKDWYRIRIEKAKEKAAKDAAEKAILREREEYERLKAKFE